MEEIDYMLNFTVGPVMASEKICSIGSNQVPYFRTNEFSNIMLENERYILKIIRNNKKIFFISNKTIHQVIIISFSSAPREKTPDQKNGQQPQGNP